MDPQNTQSKPKSSAKDVFLHLGAIVALFTIVVNLVNLLFTAINKAYPQISTYGVYSNSGSISFPVATLIIFFPIYAVLMWLLQREYKTDPEKRHLGVRKWLTYITLFIAGLTLACDLVYVLYEFIDGQELTTGFLYKALALFVITLGVFIYYISDIRGKVGAMGQKVWLGASLLVIIISITWGFMVLGSPRDQQQIKYDEQKVNDLQTINSEIVSYFQEKGSIPGTLTDMTNSETYFTIPKDEQTGVPYEYVLIGQSAKAYQLCATFNKDSKTENGDGYSYAMGYQTGSGFGIHPAGRYCFSEAIPVSDYPTTPKLYPLSPAELPTPTAQ